MNSPYASLEARFKRINLVRESASVLQWDMEALMPSGGATARSEQLATLKVIAHNMLVAPEVGEQISKVEAADGLDPWQRANLRQMKRDWRQAACLPEDLVEAFSKAVSECEVRWRAARPANDYKGLMPLLQRVLDRVREIAAIKA